MTITMKAHLILFLILQKLILQKAKQAVDQKPQQLSRNLQV